MACLGANQNNGGKSNYTHHVSILCDIWVVATVERNDNWVYFCPAIGSTALRYVSCKWQKGSEYVGQQRREMKSAKPEESITASFL